jgi:CS domain
MVRSFADNLNQNETDHRQRTHSLTMSKLSDYSKFDHLEDSDEDNATLEDIQQQRPQVATAAPSSVAAVSPLPAAVHRRHPGIANRFIFEYSGTAIYEWEQSLSEVVLYVPAPPVVNNGKIVCTISAHHLQLGLAGATQFFLDESTFAVVDTAESTWCFEEDDGKKVIAIYLHKVAKGVVWEAPLKGRFDAVLDPAALQQVQKELMLERWQEENPGMDFRGAEFNGSVPDPRTFMGGVKYD